METMAKITVGIIILIAVFVVIEMIRNKEL